MTPLFTGRAQELGRLRQLMAAASGGKGRIVAVAGEAGMGKTTFLAQAAKLAEGDGCAVLWSQMMEVPAAPPFLPWVLALRASLSFQDGETLAADLGFGAPDVATLLPELAERLAIPAAGRESGERTKLRIFVSSPGDVAAERAIATRVIARLREEFAAHADVEAVAWEHEPLLASASFQAQVADPAETDIVVTILWSRLGTRLSGDFRREDGSRYDSGTEYEFERAWNSCRERGRPNILVYRKSAELPATMGAEVGDPEQRQALERFIGRRFRDEADGAFVGAFHSFQAAEDFERLVELHLRKLIRQRLPQLHARPEHGPGAGSASSFRLFDSVTRYLLALAKRRPLVLLFDNLQLADRSSLGLLEYFCRQVAASPILVLGAVRDADLEQGHPLRATLASLARSAAFETMKLEGLSRDDAAALLHSHLDRPAPAPLVDTLHRQSDGNPLFLGEAGIMLARRAREGPLAAAGFQAGVPESLRDLIAARLDALPGETRDLLAVASVLGRDFDAGALAELAEVAEGAVFEALEPAQLARIVEPLAPGRFRFRHALFREVPYAEHAPSRRANLHQRAAERLERVHAGDPEPYLSELAHHWFEAARPGRTYRAVESCTRAAEAALARRAFSQAATQFERALQAEAMEPEPDLDRRFDLWMALGRAQQRSGQYDAAARTLLEAALLAHRQHWWPRLAEAVLDFQWALSTLAIPHDASVALHEAVLPRVPGRSMALRARLYASLSIALIAAGKRDAAEKALWEAISLSRESGDPEARIWCLKCALWVRPGPERMQERLAMAREALALGEEIGSPEARMQGMVCTLFELGEAGAIAEMQDLFPRYESLVVAERDPLHLNGLGGMKTMLAILQGRWADAVRFATQALEQASLQGVVGLEGRFGMQMFAIQKGRGALAAVAPLLKQITEGSATARLWLPGLVLLQCELGERELARKTLEKIGDLRQLPKDGLYAASLAYLAEACVALQDRERAAVVFDMLLPYRAFNVTVPWALMLGAAAGYLAPLAELLGKDDESRALFEEALALGEAMGAAPTLAKTRVDCAEFLLRHPDAQGRARARQLLEAAEAAAAAVDLQPVRTRVQKVQARLAAG